MAKFTIITGIDDVNHDLYNYPSKYKDLLIPGFDYENNNIFEIIDKGIPNYDPNIYTYKSHREYTENESKNYLGAKSCNVVYEIVQLSNSEIITNLDNSVGNFLDSEYPAWQRDKHTRELVLLLTNADLSIDEKTRRDYLLSLQNWMTENRNKRDIDQKNLEAKNILPDFNWIVKPLI